MAPKVEKISEIPRLQLGEGPHWDVATQTLYLVDIAGMSIHKYVPSTGQHTKLVFDKPVSLIVPVQGKTDQFVISLQREIVLLTWDGHSDKPTNIEKIAEVDQGTSNRINDGKCDPNGRLWAGTMGPPVKKGVFTPDAGTFFSINNRTLKYHFDKVGISNGLTWSKELNKFYFIDTLKLSVEAFDWDGDLTISNRTTIFTLKKHNIVGDPDGMTIDVDGNLWVALYDGCKVIKIDPRKPETLLQIVELPAQPITSVAWGGADLDELYVTTANFTVVGVVLDEPNGCCFRVTGLGTKGLPMQSCVL